MKKGNNKPRNRLLAVAMKVGYDDQRWTWLLLRLIEIILALEYLHNV